MDSGTNNFPIHYSHLKSMIGLGDCIADSICFVQPENGPVLPMFHGDSALAPLSQSHKPNHDGHTAPSSEKLSPNPQSNTHPTVLLFFVSFLSSKINSSSLAPIHDLLKVSHPVCTSPFSHPAPMLPTTENPPPSSLLIFQRPLEFLLCPYSWRNEAHPKIFTFY